MLKIKTKNSVEVRKKSVLHFRKALERYPNDPIFQERLGTLLISCPETGLRNLNEGMEYSHRAFTSLKSNVSTVVAAGKSLANGYSLLGDRQNAYTTINMALTIAHQNNLPEAEISALEQMLSRLRN